MHLVHKSENLRLHKTPTGHSAQSESASETSLCKLCARAAAIVLGYAALVLLFYAGLYAIGVVLYRLFAGEWL